MRRPPAATRAAPPPMSPPTLEPVTGRPVPLPPLLLPAAVPAALLFALPLPFPLPAPVTVKYVRLMAPEDRPVRVKECRPGLRLVGTVKLPETTPAELAL